MLSTNKFDKVKQYYMHTVQESAWYGIKLVMAFHGSNHSFTTPYSMKNALNDIAFLLVSQFSYVQ